LIAVVAACSPNPLADAPEGVSNALRPFVDDDFACRGPDRDVSVYSQWTCDRAGADDVSYHVVLDGDESGVKQIIGTVDQSRTSLPTSQRLVRFFAKLGSTPLAGPTGEIDAWILSHLEHGGHQHFGTVFVSLDGLQPVTNLSMIVQR
jgi:hypothetical protein